MIKIYLVGISDVGKSTIGKLLAGELGFIFYDLDKYLLQNEKGQYCKRNSPQ